MKTPPSPPQKHPDWMKRADMQRIHWRYAMKKLLGRPLMVTNRRDKRVSNVVAEIVGIYEYHVVFKYKTFDEAGKFRCYQTFSICYNSLVCGEDKVVKLD